MVNTRDRLGRVDGRYPHWVRPYDNDVVVDSSSSSSSSSSSNSVKGGEERPERYSIIYYETGGKFDEPGPAVFSIPTEK